MRRVTIALAMFGAVCLIVPVLFILAIAAETGPNGTSFRNVTTSMDSALLSGERFSMRPVTKASVLSMPRGLLVAHRYPPDPEKVFVKRIIGLPGDTIEMVGAVVRIDGRVLAEPYAWHSDTASDPAWDEFKWQRRFLTVSGLRDSAHYRPTRNNWGPVAIPAGHYVVLGDNRDNSLDSRFWGFVTPDDIVGLPKRVYFSRDPKTGRFRWGRFGHRLD